MRTLWLTWASLLTLALSGCAGESETKTTNDLPVRCLEKADPGSCKARAPKYYYDYRSNRCRAFYYGGCGGHVPFATRESCEESCVAEGRIGQDRQRER